MRIIRAAVALLLAAGAFWGLHFRHGLFPPLGKLANPFSGFWMNGDRPDAPLEVISIPGLRDKVEVVWDARHVPHIFARNDHDLYFAQGFIVARDRLWQLEFQARYAAGRLSEIVGPAALDLDRLQRRLGMVWAAEKTAQTLAADPLTGAVVQAYADGVNAFIIGLQPAELPVEYKILDYRPEPWTRLKSALLLKYMAWILSGENSEVVQTKTRDILGEEFVRNLYPAVPPYLEPIIPRGTAWDFQRARPAEAEADGRPASAPPGNATARLDGGAAAREEPRGVGSNNWAVAGSRTRSGFPILCNDPHLNLTLPSIWYELQLTAPGVSVYGVTFTGAPGVVIGFNRDAAWGMTNLGADVLDWYRVRFRDEKRREYAYGGGWRPTIVRKETIKIRGRRSVTDRVFYTHHGPVVRLGGEKALEDWIPEDAAMRWTAHDASNELKTIYLLNRARRYEDYLEALRHFTCPAQNFVYADAEGDIALWSNGRLPLRRPGQGRYILDGASPGEDWPGWVPWERNPHVRNPERGFVSSANQSPTDETYPYYLGWDFLSFERAKRINEVLAVAEDATPQDMMILQNDNFSLRARVLLPRLLPVLAAAPLAAEERSCLESLTRWNGEYASDSQAATVFDELWRALNERTWNDEKKPGLERIAWPISDVFIDLALNRPDSACFDDITTPSVESFDDLIVPAYQTALRRLTEKLGPFGRAWQWGRARGSDIPHLGRLSGFNSGKLETSGGPAVVNATQRAHGPSWKMTVALGPEIRAWGIFPGGQSGNPGSRFYDNAVTDWVNGKTYELLFMRSPDEAAKGTTARTEMRGVR